MNPQAILANLSGLVSALKQSVKTDVPTSLLPQLLSLAQSVDTKDIRSFVFAPPYFATDMWGPSHGTNSDIVIKAARVRQAAAGAFSADPKLLAQREALGAEGAQVWLVNGSSQTGLATNSSDYLTYYGVDASTPARAVSATPHTKIVAYNGAEATMPQTIAFLEKTYGVTLTTATDPTVPADIVVTLGQDAPSFTLNAVG